MRNFAILICISLFSMKSIAYLAFVKPKIDFSYSQIKADSEVTNMPRITSQDGLGICYAHVAATMMQAENCRKLKSDCANLPESELFSPLDLSRIHRPADGKAISEDLSSYHGLYVGGGDPHDVALIGALGTKEAASESCLSLDKILSKMNSRGETEEAQKNLWARLKMQFDEAKKEASSKAGCDECINNIYTTAADKALPEVEKNLNLKVDNIKVAKAFAAETFNKFLDDLLGASECRRPSQMVAFENHENVKYEMFPKNANASPKEIKEKVRDIIKKTGRPVALANICLGNENAKDCKNENSHAVVIAGYREICKSPNDCRYSFKVVNSWGKSWQDQFDGGWVDADTLLKHTKIAPDILGWFADKK
ncbi:hypothetical protein [Bdellovibrio sp. HCB-110]|uniref:hypothetical protein n=1 Tax=Bdellovibrio sp. HCB-110 TaxID=3391182 RepID=UPI0039B65436